MKWRSESSSPLRAGKSLSCFASVQVVQIVQAVQHVLNGAARGAAVGRSEAIEHFEPYP
jgi:hypothetical protein